MRAGTGAIVVLAAGLLVAFRSAPPPAATFEEREIARIQAHFDSVLVELADRDVTQLRARQRDNRSALITTLATYRDRGLFPRNYDFAAPTPYFVDRQTGVLCAVAHLLASTGRRDIVDRVAAADNNVWVPALAGDAAFNGWLVEHGLTLAEAARIQVPYIGPIDEQPAPAPAQRVSRISLAGSGLASGAFAVNLLSNRDGQGMGRNIIGLTAGLASAGYGVGVLGTSEVAPTYGVVNVAAGALSAWLSGRAILRHRNAVAERRQAERSSVAVAPVVSAAGGSGVSVHVRF